MTLHHTFRKTLTLALAGATGVTMSFGWVWLGVLLALGATYEINALVRAVREE